MFNILTHVYHICISIRDTNEVDMDGAVCHSYLLRLQKINIKCRMLVINHYLRRITTALPFTVFAHIFVWGRTANIFA